MLAALVIALREGLEAALIVAIVLAYLNRSQQKEMRRWVWLGALFATLGSAVVGAGFLLISGGYGGPTEELFEMSAMLLAVAVITYMVVWMKNQAARRGRELEGRVESAARTGSGPALLGLVFVSVLREGLELVLFLYAAFIGNAPWAASAGMLLGLLLAVSAGYALYRGTYRLSLGKLFRYTGVLLIVFGAGLLGQAVKILQEMAYLPVALSPIWDTSWILTTDGALGVLLGTLIGYDPQPTLLQMTAYAAYILVALRLFTAQTWRQVAVVATAALVVAVGVTGWAQARSLTTEAPAAIEGPAAPLLPDGAVIEMTLRQFEYEPGRLTVRPGTSLTLEATSEDVAHGLAVPGGGSLIPAGKTRSVTFTAPEEPGAYVFPCTIPCGDGHDEMKWVLVVAG